MPKSAKPRSARPKPRSATKTTSRDRKRSLVGLSATEQVHAAEAEAGRPANPDGSVPQGEPVTFSAENAPGTLPGPIVGTPPRLHRHLVGKEHAVTGSGAPHPTAGDAGKGAAEGERFQAIVGPPESASPTAALDNAMRAATAGDEKAVWDALPAGTIIESLGPMHGFRAIGTGMHRPMGIGATPLDAVKNIGVPIIRDEELPLDQQSAARRAQVAKEAFAREQAQTTTAPVGAGANR